MKPPICSVCDKRFGDDEGGVIYFKKRKEDHDWDKKMEENDLVGHPPYARWFCGDHYGKALENSGLPVDEAMKLIRD